MAQLWPTQLDHDAMELEVERRITGRTAWFQLVIPRSFWESLLGVGGPSGQQMSVTQAYEQERAFWDALAELATEAAHREMAELAPLDRFSGRPRHVRHVWPDLPSLTRAYAEHRRTAERGREQAARL